MKTFTDEEMGGLLPTAREYSVVILKRGPRFGEHRSRRRMVQVKSLGAAQNRWIPANCHMNGGPYIGADAAVHSQAAPS